MANILKLKAKNSSGEQILSFDHYGADEYGFSLWGEYRGEEVQFDFDSISKDEAFEMLKKLYKEFKSE